MNDSVTDFPFGNQAADKAAEIEIVQDSEIQSAAQRVVEAAEKARKDEAPNAGMGGNNGRDEFMENIPGSYDWIPGRYERFYERMTSAPRAMAENIGNGRANLDSGFMSDINIVDTAVARWAGKARDEYYNNFISPFPAAVTHQQALFAELETGLYAYETELRESRRVAKKIADDTVKVLDGMNSGFLGSSQEEQQLAIAIGLAVIATIGTAATTSTGLGLAIGFALVANGGSIGRAGMSLGAAKEEKADIKGGTVEEILQSMQDALDKLWDDMQLSERGIADAWNETLSDVEAHVNSGDARKKRTILPHEPSGDEIPDLTGDEDMSTDPTDGDFRVRD